jgi:hypothetical protein
MHATIKTPWIITAGDPTRANTSLRNASTAKATCRDQHGNGTEASATGAMMSARRGQRRQHNASGDSSAMEASTPAQ